MAQKSPAPTRTWPARRGWQVTHLSGRNTHDLILGTWNVRTLLNRDTNTRPQRRTALVAKELKRYRVDIAALSETRLAEEGSLTEKASGYTFYWKGKAKDEDRIHGVGFAIKTSIANRLPSLPVAINERLMKLRLPISNNRYATIISSYAPTLTSAEETIELFYSELSDTLSSVSDSDKLLLLGDFNARVGNDYQSWKGILGMHGLGKTNSNGLLLLSKCAEFKLCITNTMFRLQNKYKTTWMHPRSRQWHLIDYIIVRQRDLKDVCITRAMRGAECWTDHRLVRTKMKLKIAPPRNRTAKKGKKAYNITKLKQTPILERFQNDINSKLSNTNSSSVDQKWSQFKDALTQSAESVLGFKKRLHQDWFDENDNAITDLINRKNQAHTEWLRSGSLASKQRFKALQATVQRDLRKMENDWWDQKADEIQNYADMGNSKELFGAIKNVYGPSQSNTCPLLSSDGSTLIKDKEGLTKRWREHFSQLLNRPSEVNQEALNRIPDQDPITELDNLPSLPELQKAIKRMKNGKAAGKDRLTAELFKALNGQALQEFHEILTTIWQDEQIPKDLRDATIISLYKNKGSRADCGNYRGISLLSIAGKVLARILLTRLVDKVSEQHLPETQCGFRPGRSTTDMIFIVRQLQEKCIEQHMDLFAIFIDLTKAFDCINRNALWTILQKLGCPRKFSNLIRLLHQDMTGEVYASGETSEPFLISTGVKQGCVLAPVLFNLFLTQMLHHALGNCTQGVYIKYRPDGSLFDLRRLAAKTRTQSQLVTEAMFADDCALMAHSEADLQLLATKFNEAADLFGLTVSIAKTEVMHQPAPSQPSRPMNVLMNNTSLKTVDSFKYLGSTISNDGSLDREIAQRIQKASSALGRLKKKVLLRSGIKTSTKLKLYKAIVLTSLLYGAECWTTYRRHVKRLESFHQRALRNLIGVKWQDKVSNAEVLRRTKSASIEATLIKAQLRWSGHMIRMDRTRLPRQVFYGELKSGKRNTGRPRKRYKDNIKQHLKTAKENPAHLEQLAADRPTWRGLTKTAANAADADRCARKEAAKARRAARALQPPDPSNTATCTICGRVCASSFGLRSHLRTHRP